MNDILIIYAFISWDLGQGFSQFVQTANRHWCSCWVEKPSPELCLSCVPKAPTNPLIHQCSSALHFKYKYDDDSNFPYFANHFHKRLIFLIIGTFHLMNYYYFRKCTMSKVHVITTIIIVKYYLLFIDQRLYVYTKFWRIPLVGISCVFWLEFNFFY